MNRRNPIDRVIEDTWAKNRQNVLGGCIATAVHATVPSLVEAELRKAQNCPYYGARARLLGPISLVTPTVGGCLEFCGTIDSEVCRG